MAASTALLTSLIILIGLAVVRHVRIYLFRKELFWELDPIIEADKWEGYKRDRKRSWTARRRRGADAAFAPTRAAAAVVIKYLDLEARPWFAPWPRREDIVRVTVRIPPRTHLHAIHERLAATVAKYLNVPEGNLRAREERHLLRGKRVSFAVL